MQTSIWLFLPNRTCALSDHTTIPIRTKIIEKELYKSQNNSHWLLYVMLKCPSTIKTNPNKRRSTLPVREPASQIEISTWKKRPRAYFVQSLPWREFLCLSCFSFLSHREVYLSTNEHNASSSGRFLFSISL